MIDKLEFLIAVARERNFRRAAEACGVAQPTLSAAIKSLEETLGVLLVQRNSRFQGLTPEGERVLEWAKRMVGDARAMRDEVRALRRGLSGLLRVGVIPSALPCASLLTRHCQAQHPGMRVQVLSRSSADILDLLDNLQLDAGITYLGTETIGRLQSLPLFIERYRLLTTASGPMGARERLTWAEAAALPLCLPTPDLQNRRILDRLLGTPASDPNPCDFESDSMISLLSHVRQGGRATILSQWVAQMMGSHPPFRIIPLVEPDAAFQVGLVASNRQPVAPLVAALLSSAKRLAADPSLDRFMLSQHGDLPLSWDARSADTIA